MADNRRVEAVVGVAIMCGMTAGFAAFLVAVFAFFTRDFTGAGVCLAAAGLSFGLVANAALRR